MKVLLATQKPFSAAAVEAIRKIFIDAASQYEFAVLEKYPGEEDLAAALAGVDALIVRSDKVGRTALSGADSLKLVVRAGAGYDNLDLEALSEKGVIAMNTPGQNSNAVAELAIAMMIYISRGCFTPATGIELSGRRLGIQAYGNVGRLVAAKAKALGMSVSAFDPFVPAAQIAEDGVTPLDSLEALYSTSDFVSLHIPALPSTIGSIGSHLLELMPKGGCLVNTARKEVIAEAELLRTLTETRPDLKYVADVAPDNLAALSEACGTRVFATPKKMGAQTTEANVNAGLAAARQIVAFLEDGVTKFALNLKK